MFSVYQEPQIINNFLPLEICDSIIKKSKCVLYDSVFVDTTTNEEKFNRRIRVCKTAYLDRNEPEITEVLNRCTKHTNKTLRHCELPMILNYKPGGYFKPHQDGNLTDKNKRIYTILISLNDEYEGGETEFPLLNKKYRLPKGDALLWYDCDLNKNLTKLSLHAGNEVISGEKWITTVWIRDFPIEIN